MRTTGKQFFVKIKDVKDAFTPNNVVNSCVGQVLKTCVITVLLSLIWLLLLKITSAKNAATIKQTTS